MTQHFIVIGNPIEHSKSPQIHKAFAEQVGLDIEYNRVLCPIDEHYESFFTTVRAFFCGGGVGANVTVPFKYAAYELCLNHGDMSKRVALSRSVNTLYLDEHKQLIGENTDGAGLVNHLKEMGWALAGRKVAILGAGGAARGVFFPLIDAEVEEIVFANRTVEKATAFINEFTEYAPLFLNPDRKHMLSLKSCPLDQLEGEFDIIINATSIGLEDTGKNQLPLSENLSCQYAYDMMYGRELPFLQHFAQKGAKVSDGLGMLVHQAALSFEIWTGNMVDAQIVLQQMQRKYS